MPELVRRGASVVALVREGSPRTRLASEGWIGRIATVRGSLTDEGLMLRAFREHGIQTVFHLGAQTLAGVAMDDPAGTLEANVRGSWMLLDAARQCNVGQVVVASSAKAYGDSAVLPYREDHPLQAAFPYDVSKTCTDLIATMYARSYGLGTAVVRCGNLFGGGDVNFSRLIPGVIMATRRGERFLIRSDGRFVRDFLYVEDAVDAYLRLAEKVAADSSLAGEAFNFGLEQRPTMLELAEKVLAMMGRTDLRPIVQNLASAEIREMYLDATKARTRLSWTPRHGMDEGLRRTIEWYRRFHAQEEESQTGSGTATVAAARERVT